MHDDTSGPTRGHSNLTCSLGAQIGEAPQTATAVDSAPFGAAGLGAEVEIDVVLEFHHADTLFRVTIQTATGETKVYRVARHDLQPAYHNSAVERALMAAREHLERAIAMLPERREIAKGERFVERQKPYKQRGRYKPSARTP